MDYFSNVMLIDQMIDLCEDQVIDFEHDLSKQPVISRVCRRINQIAPSVGPDGERQEVTTGRMDEEVRITICRIPRGSLILRLISVINVEEMPSGE